MQTRRRFVEQNEFSGGVPVRAAFREKLHELQPLRLAAGERVERLPEREVAQPDVFERAELRGDRARRSEEATRLGHRHGENFRDVFPVEAEFQHFPAEAFPFADRARHVHLGKELHLDGFPARAAAVRAAPVAAVEREMRRRQPESRRLFRSREQPPHVFPHARVKRRVRARRLRDGGLVDEHDLAERLVALEDERRELEIVFGGNAGFFRREMRQHVVHQRRFSRTGNAADADERAHRELRREAAQVVRRHAAQTDFRRGGEIETPPGGFFGNARAAQPRARRGFRAAANAGGNARVDEPPALRARPRSDFDQPIRRAHDGFVVLDDDDGVPAVDEPAQNRGHFSEVARVQPDAGFVEDEKRVGERGAEAGREVHALRFPARKRAGLAVERQVTQPDFPQKRKAVQRFGERGFLRRGNAAAATLRRERLGKQREKLVRRFREQRRQRVPAPFPAQRFLAETRAAAFRTFHVGAEARKKNAHVHFVGRAFQPREKAPHAVPAARPVFVRPVLVAREHELALRLGKRVPRHVRRDFHAAAGAQQVALRLAVNFAGKRSEDALGERLRLVGNDFSPVELDHAPEAAAARTRADGRVEGEQRRRRLSEAAARRRGNQPVRVDAALGEGPVAVFPEEKDDPAAEPHRRRRGFEEAGTLRIGNFDTVGGDENFPRVRGNVLFGAFPRLAPDRRRRMRAQRRSRRGIDQFRAVREPDFHPVAKLRHRPDRRTRRLHGIALANRDGGAHVLDGVDVRLRQQLEELPRVGRKRLDVAALPFGVQRFEDERRFPGAAQPGDDDELSDGNVDVDSFEIVLAHSAQADGFRLRLFHAFLLFGNNLF